MRSEASSAFAGGHPVAVAPQGVDLTVVRDVAVGVGQRPRGECVRREPGVHQGERAGDPFVREVRVERLELRLGEHALVDQRARRQAREVRAGLVLRALAQAERAPLQRDARQRVPSAPSPPRHDSWRNAARGPSLGPGRPGRLGRDVGASRHRKFSSAAASRSARPPSRPSRPWAGTRCHADAPAASATRSRPRRRNSSGTWIRIRRRPGVVLGAARAAVLEPQQPVGPLRTIAWPRRPGSATRATPHASCSFSAIQTGGRGNRPVSLQPRVPPVVSVHPDACIGTTWLFVRSVGCTRCTDQLVRSGNPVYRMLRTGEQVPDHS
jgi:hypothetical protein